MTYKEKVREIYPDAYFSCRGSYIYILQGYGKLIYSYYDPNQYSDEPTVWRWAFNSIQQKFLLKLNA